MKVNCKNEYWRTTQVCRNAKGQFTSKNGNSFPKLSEEDKELLREVARKKDEECSRYREIQKEVQRLEIELRTDVVDMYGVKVVTQKLRQAQIREAKAARRCEKATEVRKRLLERLGITNYIKGDTK
jgi:TRAP-type C4-dicarboxylate transport system substrate-binding protein